MTRMMIRNHLLSCSDALALAQSQGIEAYEQVALRVARSTAELRPSGRLATVASMAAFYVPMADEVANMIALGRERARRVAARPEGL